MERVMEARRLWLAPLEKAPPRWAVLVVEVCVIGILLLPLASFLWVLLYRPTETSDLSPIAFLVAGATGVTMFCCASILTSVYPRVPRRG